MSRQSDYNYLFTTSTFEHPSDKTDLEDENLTTHELCNLLSRLAKDCGHPLLILSVRTDHSVDSGPHSHNPGGDSADIYPADWTTNEEATVNAVLHQLALYAQQGVLVYEVGCGGIVQNWQNQHSWPAGFDIFTDNDEDHIHVSGLLTSDDPTWKVS